MQKEKETGKGKKITSIGFIKYYEKYSTTKECVCGLISFPKGSAIFFTGKKLMQKIINGKMWMGICKRFGWNGTRKVRKKKVYQNYIAA